MRTPCRRPPGRHLRASNKPGAIQCRGWISPGAWGQGAAGWLADLALPQVRRAFGHAPLVVRIHLQNTPSIRLVERRGFQREDTDDTNENALTIYARHG